MVNACTVNQIQDKESWYVDNGATTHIAVSRKMFTDFREFDSNHTVTTADGTVIPAVGIGSIKVESKDATDTTEQDDDGEFVDAEGEENFPAEGEQQPLDIVEPLRVEVPRLEGEEEEIVVEPLRDEPQREEEPRYNLRDRCKRVEAPESAIECEEVVEDTNMQFPFCCTRLRCLVVVRGEVWTRVLGQPWEVLPAAPWSHMYKMKKPPPADSTFLPKPNEQGPVYELSENESDTGGHDKVLRSGKKPVTDPDCNEIEPKAAPPPPDIVIALSTNNNEIKEQSHKKYEARRLNPKKIYLSNSEDCRRTETKHENSRHKRPRKTTATTTTQYFEEDRERDGDNKGKEREKHTESEVQEVEEIPASTDKEPQYQAQDTQPQEVPEPKAVINPAMKAKDDKPSNLQVLVDAIGTRMRDIESVVQKMSEKVHQAKPGVEGSVEKRFSVLSNQGSKYLHSFTDSPTEPPLIFGDTNLTGYFSDASNSEPPPTYMAPVETRRSKLPVQMAVVSDNLDDKENKKKKHSHKKRRGKGSHSHKKHTRSKEDKKKHYNRLSSGEIEKNIVSLEDSSALAKK
ncbi:hypothetical protein HF086_013643 [Spodoptera exigua]|uniref:Retrovirus-related Pol polyprotein from transposon TNT 1-94-like beta-barrel domain-containing protein n=1 Tax=Spodoptera exigua TaxID=7107 RepID=A0A922MA44_SPOEX|nr:hypothetical protein HF086_013643 [Spodoptera exigua]